MTSNKFNITSTKYNWPKMFVQKEDGIYVVDKNGERPATKEEIEKMFGPIEGEI